MIITEELLRSKLEAFKHPELIGFDVQSWPTHPKSLVVRMYGRHEVETYFIIPIDYPDDELRIEVNFFQPAIGAIERTVKSLDAT